MVDSDDRDQGERLLGRGEEDTSRNETRFGRRGCGLEMNSARPISRSSARFSRSLWQDREQGAGGGVARERSGDVCTGVEL